MSVCTECGGSGKINETHDPIWHDWDECPKCHGTGKSNREEVRLTEEEVGEYGEEQYYYDMSERKIPTGIWFEKENVETILNKRLALQSAEISALKSQIQGIKDRLSKSNIEKVISEFDFLYCDDSYISKIVEAIHNKINIDK